MTAANIKFATIPSGFNSFNWSFFVNDDKVTYLTYQWNFRESEALKTQKFSFPGQTGHI